MSDVMIPKNDIKKLIVVCLQERGKSLAGLMLEMDAIYPDPEPNLWWRRQWVKMDSMIFVDRPWAKSQEDFDKECYHGFREGDPMYVRGPWESRTFEEGT